MEPRVQYAKTSDGVNIAYSVTGEGPPLVHLSWFPLSALQAEWQITPEVRPWYERLAETRMLVRYDCRGTGLSERDVTDFSVDARILDLEAIVDRLHLERFALFASLHSGPVAIAYAARHPGRVSQLVLWHAYALGSDFSQSPQVQGTRAVLDKDWHTFTETAAHALVVGWKEGELAQRVAVLFRESIAQEAMQAFVPVGNEVDLTDLLPQVRVPTLVLHRRELSVLSLNVARGVAARIPDARLALLEGAAMLPYVGNMKAALDAIDEFLSGDTEPVPSVLSGTAVILFADIVDSTALTERMGDAAFREKARALDEALRAAIRECEGTPIEGKLLGDGLMAVFTSARQAIEAALACGRAGNDGGLPLHLGLHAGDVIREEDGNVYGGAVNIAARIAAASAPGEVLVSETVRSLARTSAGVSFEDRGEQALKGVLEPQRLFAIKTT